MQGYIFTHVFEGILSLIKMRTIFLMCIHLHSLIRRSVCYIWSRYAVVVI